MAFLNRAKRIAGYVLAAANRRGPFSRQSAVSTKSGEETDIVKSVFISQSNDIFSNLALEDWMYRNMNFSRHHAMLLWRNEPCVVVGRHQNPWLEANLGRMAERGLRLARRNSGGGAVYHDGGNLNVTFFAPRDRYNRKLNLQLIARALQKNWQLNAQINKREDITLNSDYKISGTASKLGRPNSYHHCTLLVNVDKRGLVEALNTDGSVPCPTVNLCDVREGISVDDVVTGLGWAYLAEHPITRRDMGWEFVANQRGFQLVNPTDMWFPGLEKIREELESWEWVYGKTPKFEVRRNVKVAADDGDGWREATLSVEVEGGLVTGARLLKTGGGDDGGRPQQCGELLGAGLADALDSVTGLRYTEDVLTTIERALGRHVATTPAISMSVATN